MQDIVADFERSTILHGAWVEGIRIEPGSWIRIDFMTPRRFAVFFTTITSFQVNFALSGSYVLAWSASQESGYLREFRKAFDTVPYPRNLSDLLHFRLKFHGDRLLDVIAEDFHFVICERF